MLNPDSPAGWPHPMIRSSTLCGSSWGTCSRAALTIVAERSSGRQSTSEPFMARPMGLRAVETMTASVMGSPPRAAARSLWMGDGSPVRRVPVVGRTGLRGVGAAMCVGVWVPVWMGVWVPAGSRRKGAAGVGPVGRAATPGLDPPAEPCGVRVDAVERLELLAVRGVGALEVVAEAVGEGVGDVAALAPGGECHLGPLAQRALGLGEDLPRVGDQPEVGER